MADMFGPQYKADQSAIDRRRQMAQALVQQALTPQQGQMAGRIYVPPGPLSAISRVVQGYFGGKGMKGADEEEKALGERYQSQMSNEMQKVTQALIGQQAIPQPPAELGGGPGRPEVPPDPRQALAEAMKAQSPAVRGMAPQLFNAVNAADARTENREARAEDRRARAEQRLAEIELQGRNRLDQIEMQQRMGALDRAAADQRRADLQRELAATRAATQMELARMRLEAAQSKAGEKATSKQNAQQRVSDNLQMLATYYEQLQKLGATVDADKSAASNIWARIRNTGIGQTIGGALGTTEQSYRDSIAMMRPLLLQDIRQASQMGARGLDSNKELEFYMAAATDPARGIQANRAALAVLDRAYGLGMGIQGVSDEDMATLRSEFGGGKAAPAAGGDQGPVKITSDAEFDALPSGTMFLAPDGSVRRKP